MPFEVEVVYALPDQQTLRRLTVGDGCTAGQAVELSGLALEWLSSDAAPLALARFGRLIGAETLLLAGDRVEILRPLCTDPKDQRRNRAKTAARAKRARSL